MQPRALLRLPHARRAPLHAPSRPAPLPLRDHDWHGRRRRRAPPPSVPAAASSTPPSGDGDVAAAAAAQQPQQQDQVPWHRRLLSPPPLPQSPADLLPTRGAWQALKSAAELALANAWALAALAFARDSATFLLHRLSQRATNAAASLAIGNDVVSAAAPNAWWLCLDPAFLEAFPGYQALVALFFALALPVNVAVNAAAMAAAVVLCTSPRGLDGALMLPRRAYRSGGGAQKQQQKKKKRRNDRPPPQGPLAVRAGGAWWAAAAAAAAAEGSGGGGPGRAGTASTSSNAGRSGCASFSTASPPPRIGLPSAIRPPLTRLPLGPLKGPSRGLAAAVAATRAALATPGLLWRAWCADLWVSAQSVPLQALALAVLPAPWAVPRLLAIQLAVPAAVLEADDGEAQKNNGQRPATATGAAPAMPPASSSRVRAAADSARRSVARSCELMRGRRTAYAWPFVAAYALGRAIEAARDAAMAAVPQRWWADVPELPLAAVAAFGALRFLVARALELLPLAFYLEERRRQRAAERDAGSGDKGGGGGDADAVPATAGAP